MLTEADITEALGVCYDPELRINVVDLGRVHAIALQGDTEAPGPFPRARVVVTLLSRNEEQDLMLVATITNRLLGIREISQAKVVLVDAPPWTPDRMTPEGKRERSRQQGLVQLGGVL